MIHTSGQPKLSQQQILTFLREVDTDFPVRLSSKTDLEDYAEKLCTRSAISYEAEGDRIIGMVAGYTEHTIHQMSFITLVAVAPDKRGLGLGRGLVQGFLDEAARCGLTAVHLYAVRDNEPAMRLYQRLGFVECTLLHDPRPEDAHFIYYLRPRTALVTAIGSFSADIVIKTLKQQGYRTVGCDIYNKEWIADAYNVSVFYQVPRVSDEDSFLRTLEEICENERITHILPSTDIEVDFFNKHRAAFERKNIQLCISSEETLKICRNKKKQQEFIDREVPEIRTIPTVLLDDVTEPPFAFPMICKPFDGRSSQGVRYLYTEEDWKLLKAVPNSTKYVVQPVIAGPIVTVDVVRQSDGGCVVAVPREELLRTLNGAGTSVRVYPDRRLEEGCRRLANALRILGCVNFEFIHAEDGDYYYIECNPRFSGGVEFSCIAGYDFVGNHLRSFEHKAIDDFRLQKEVYIARKYEEYVTRVDY